MTEAMVQAMSQEIWKERWAFTEKRNISMAGSRIWNTFTVMGSQDETLGGVEWIFQLPNESNPICKNSLENEGEFGYRVKSNNYDGCSP